MALGYSGSAPDIGAIEYTWDVTPTCNEGQIISTCLCGGTEYSSGYCCNDIWQSTQCSAPITDPILHFKFEEGSGITATDSSENNNDGNINGAVYTTDSKRGNYALKFDGVDDYVEVINSPSLNVNYLTASIWFKPYSFRNDNGLVAKGDNSNRQYWLWIYENNLSLEIDEGGYYNYIYPLQTDTWYYLSITYDGFNIITYINGVEVNRIPQSTGEILIDDDSFLIGKLPGYISFNGSIDEMRIYNRALNSTEILALYQSTSSCGNADSNTDGSVSITELIDYITDWKAGIISITELISGIGEWKNGCS